MFSLFVIAMREFFYRSHAPERDAEGMSDSSPEQPLGASLRQARVGWCLVGRCKGFDLGAGLLVLSSIFPTWGEGQCRCPQDARVACVG